MGIENPSFGAKKENQQPQAAEETPAELARQARIMKEQNELFEKMERGKKRSRKSFDSWQKRADLQ